MTGETLLVIKDKDAYILQLENQVQNLEKQVNNLTEIIILLRKQKFGSSSEKTPKSQFDGQLNLQEAEQESASDAKNLLFRE